MFSKTKEHFFQLLSTRILNPRKAQFYRFLTADFVVVRRRGNSLFSQLGQSGIHQHFNCFSAQFSIMPMHSLALLAITAITLGGRAATFTDANWTSMDGGQGVNNF